MLRTLLVPSFLERQRAAALTAQAVPYFKCSGWSLLRVVFKAHNKLCFFLEP